MNKKGVIGVGFLLILLIMVGGLILKVYVLDKGVVNTPRGEEKLEFTSERNGFTLVARYQTENKEEHVWEYKITGTLPFPCYNTDVQPIVLESYPEQVSVLLTLTPPEEDVECIQVLDEDFERTGEFKASDKAKISFVVDSSTQSPD